jgi:hypothetical protein
MTSSELRPKCLIALSFFALTCINGMAAPAPPTSDGLRPLGQLNMDEYKKPEYAKSRCMISPLLSSDSATVALSVNRVFAGGDTILSIGGTAINESSPTAVRDLLIKHGPNEEVVVKLRRAGKEQAVTAHCSDAKVFYDLVLEASYAASKSDAVTCGDKLREANRLHAFQSSLLWLAFQCDRVAGKLSNPSDLARNFYEVNRVLILESAWSTDAIGRIRGTILEAVNTLQNNNGTVLGEDLKQQYDQAVAAASAQSVAAPKFDRQSPPN